jgi:hypothetical protein
MSDKTIWAASKAILSERHAIQQNEAEKRQGVIDAANGLLRSLNLAEIEGMGNE